MFWFDQIRGNPSIIHLQVWPLIFFSNQTSDSDSGVLIFSTLISIQVIRIFPLLPSQTRDWDSSSASEMFACTFFFIQERLNGMKHVKNKILVWKKYELYQIFYRKQYPNFKLFKLQHPIVTLFLHLFTPTLTLPLILFQIRNPILTPSPKFLLLHSAGA